MNYELLPNKKSIQIRERFENTFLKTFDSYASETPSILRYTNPVIMYSAMFLDDVIKLDFYDALGELAKIQDNVYFMSDKSPLGERCALNAVFVAQTKDTKSLAKQIFDEWCREYHLGNYIYSQAFRDKTNGLFDDSIFQNILPFDLYIIDESMKWMLAFTHEECESEDEDLCDMQPQRCCYLIRR